MVARTNRQRGRKAWALAALVLAGVLVSPPAWSQADRRVETARIGVLAFRGAELARKRWSPLSHYLTARLKDWRFELVPVTLVSAAEQLASNRLHFLITNPGHYVTLAERFGLSVLATRERRFGGARTGLLRYGSAIIVRAGRKDISTISDLKGKTLAAVSADAFGGFQVAWYEFRAHGLNPFEDLKALRFIGFPQDEIVAAVRNKRADAGVVRSGLLEQLEREGQLEGKSFDVLLGNSHVDYPFRVSSRLYPEWPFAARQGIDKRLVEHVAMALLETQRAGVADTFGLKDLWSAPLAYDGVRKVIASLGPGKTGAGTIFSGLKAVSVVVATLVATAALILAFYGGVLAKSRGLGGLKTGRRPGAAKHNMSEADTDAEQTDRFDTLTKREREVLSLVCQGEPTKRIADALGISPKTVEYHRANLLQKTGAGTTPHMVQLATRHGFDKIASVQHDRQSKIVSELP